MPTAAGDLDNASNGEFRNPSQCNTVGAHIAEVNNNSRPSAIATTRAGVAGADGGNVAAISVLPADAVSAENCSNDSRCNDIHSTTVKPSFGQKELECVCLQFLGVPGSEVRCNAPVACIPQCFVESSCVGQRPVTAKPQSAKRTGAVACDAGKATTTADSSHSEQCNKRTRHEQEAPKVKSIPLTVPHESAANRN